MAAKKILKLVNNERTNSKLASQKACEAGSVDTCPVSYDYADCATYAYDECIKEDHAGCYDGADDICGNDIDACSGAGVDDIDR